MYRNSNENIRGQSMSVNETQIFRTNLRVEATIDEKRPQNCSSVRGFSQMVKSDRRFLHAKMN